LTVNRWDTGGTRRVRTPDFEEKVLAEVRNDPDASVRTIARTLGASRSSVWNVLTEQ